MSDKLEYLITNSFKIGSSDTGIPIGITQFLEDKILRVGYVFCGCQLILKG
jgi:hypothetical protein